MRVTLEYNSSTGELTDATGMFLFNWQGLNHFPADQKCGAEGVLRLMAQGLTFDQVVQLGDRGLV
jgi:hypothetical protein